MRSTDPWGQVMALNHFFKFAVIRIEQHDECWMSIRDSEAPFHVVRTISITLRIIGYTPLTAKPEGFGLR